MSKEMWDQRYADTAYVYGTNPNEFFKQELDKLKTGKILLPAEGEGRNAVYASEHGWEVWAFDQSGEGRKKALQLASAKRVSINYDIRNLATVEYPMDFFDAIALVFVHSPEMIRQATHRNLLRFLKPGGTLILIGFSKDQLKYESGGPKDESMLFSLEDLEQDFSDLTLSAMEQREICLEEGGYHSGKGSVIQLVAVK